MVRQICPRTPTCPLQQKDESTMAVFCLRPVWQTAILEARFTSSIVTQTGLSFDNCLESPPNIAPFMRVARFGLTPVTCLLTIVQKTYTPLCQGRPNIWTTCAVQDWPKVVGLMHHPAEYLLLSVRLCFRRQHQILRYVDATNWAVAPSSSLIA
jgi:hypothetical protein